MKKIILFTIITLSILIIGCSKDIETFEHESLHEDWTMDIPQDFIKNVDETLDDTNSILYENQEGTIIKITEIRNGELIVTEEIILNEVSPDEHLHIENTGVGEIEGIGTVYISLIDNHETHENFIYYKTKVDKDIVSIIVSKIGKFSEEEFERYNNMIKSIKLLKK